MYDDLIPDFFGVPANPGAPTILETAFEWLAFAPDGTVQDFSSETGIPVCLVERYWKRLQILAALDEEDRNIKNVALEWLRQNPNDGKNNFTKLLGVSQKSLKHLAREDDPFPDIQEQKQLETKMVKAWFEQNPDGDMKQCAKETGISYYLVRDFCKASGRLSYNKRVEDVEPVLEQWIRENPNEKRSAAMQKFGASMSLVTKVRRKIKYEDDGRTIKLVSVDLARKCALWMFKNPDGSIGECARHCGLTMDQVKNLMPSIDIVKDELNQLSAWIADNPQSSIHKCIKKTKINNGTIYYAWKDLGGGDYATMQEVASKEITNRIRDWMEEHKDYPTIAECSKDLGVCKKVIKDNWKQAGGNNRSASDIRSEQRILEITKWLIEHPDCNYYQCAESLSDLGTTMSSIAIYSAKVKKIARWRIANPNGTQEDCSRGLNMPLRKVINYWSASTLWIENGSR